MSNDFSIPEILKLDCVKKTDLMYITIGGFDKTMASVMEGIHFMTSHIFWNRSKQDLSIFQYFEQVVLSL